MSQQVFNGFCYRPYDEKKDGWMERVADISDYPALQEGMRMFDDLQFYQKRVWELEQKVESLLEYVPEHHRHIYK